MDSIVQYTIPTNEFVEALRVVALIMGGAIVATVAFYVKDWRCLPHDRPQKMRYLALLLYGVIVMLQQVEQFGSPLLAWRLPLILVANVLALYGLYADGWEKYFKVQSRPEPQPMDWTETIENERAKHRLPADESRDQRRQEDGREGPHEPRPGV